MPYADVNFRVATRTDATALRLVKLRPYESWGTVKFNFFVEVRMKIKMSTDSK